MSAASNRGLSARTIALGSVAVLAGLAAINRQRALDAQRRYPPRGDFIRVRGVRLHKIDTGGPGPAVILLHGNGVTLADMEISGLVARAARRRRVVAFDRPGFGYSERPRGIAWTPAAQADLLADALERMGIEQALSSVTRGEAWLRLRSRSIIPGWCRGWSWCRATISRRRAPTLLSSRLPPFP